MTKEVTKGDGVRGMSLFGFIRAAAEVLVVGKESLE